MVISMFVMLFICMTARPMRGIRADNADTDELGKGIYIPKTNLLADFQEDEASVFNSFPPNCFIRKPIRRIRQEFNYYKSSKEFFSKIAAGADLDASLKSTYTLGVTLNSFAQNVHSQESTVSGISLDIRSLTSKIIVRKDCLQKRKTLSQRFTKDLERLPLTIRKPWLQKSWERYNTFLKKYGSHVIKSVSRGASIKQTSFAQSSKSYSKRDLEVKSCVSLAGPTSVGQVGVQACANVSKSEISKANNMNTQDEFIIRGGSIKTASALNHNRTKELIEKLLKEAGKWGSSVEYTFASLWRILLDCFKAKTPNFIRALNIQYYFLGYLNYGCGLQKSGNVYLRKFDYTKHSRKESPEFKCTLPAKGCHSNDDCHYRVGVKCHCYGNSCVRYKDEKEVTEVKKRLAYINRDKGWGWHGCDWQTWGSRCGCYNNNKGKRTDVWTLPSRDVVQQGSGHDAHHLSENQDQSGDAEDEEEEEDDDDKDDRDDLM